MTLYDYIVDLRIRIDDEPYGIDPYYTNAQLATFINNARRDIARKLGFYEKYKPILPKLFIDEYDLPTDFKQCTIIYDIELQKEHYPSNKANAETTRTYLDLSITDNLFYINETRKKLTFLTPPDLDMVELPYAVATFDRDKNKITVDSPAYTAGTGTIAVSTTGVTISGGSTTEISVDFLVKDSAGTVVEVESITNNYHFVVNAATLATGTGAWSYARKLSTLGDWASIKPFAKLSHGATNEYIRISKITNTCSSEYTIWVSSWDVLGDYKNQVNVYDYVSLTNNSSAISGTNTMMRTDLAVGEVVYFNGSSMGAVNGVTNDYYATVNTTWLSNTVTAVTNTTIKVDSRPVFVDNDNIYFVTYMMNYKALPPTIKMMYAEDTFPYDAQRLVPVKAAIEAEMRRSRPEEALRHENEFNMAVMELNDELRDKDASLYNDSLIY